MFMTASAKGGWPWSRLALSSRNSAFTGLPTALKSASTKASSISCGPVSEASPLDPYEKGETGVDGRGTSRRESHGRSR